MNTLTSSKKKICIICGSFNSITQFGITGRLPIPIMSQYCDNCNIVSGDEFSLFINKHMNIIWTSYYDKISML